MSNRELNSSTSSDIEAANQIYQAAKVDAEIALSQKESQIEYLTSELEAKVGQAEAIGVLKKINMDRAYNDLVEALVLFRVKESRSYKKGGFTWEEFCSAVNVDRKTADNIINDVRPVFTAFSENVSGFVGVPFNKIRYLGKTFPETFSGNVQDGPVVVNGVEIPRGGDDFEPAIDKLKEVTAKQREEHETTIRTKDRLIQAKEDVIRKQEREIARLEKTVVIGDLSPEDQELIDLMAKIQGDFVAGIFEIKKRIPYDTGSSIALRHLYFLYIFFQKVACDERLALHEQYRDAMEVPWEIQEEELPPADMLVDNTPLTRGTGEAYRRKVLNKTGTETKEI